MTATLIGALATALILGATHAIEPDHVAGISSLTSRYGDPRLSAMVGVCFGAGHVVLVVAWLVVAYLILGSTTFPESIDTLGTVGVSILLAGLGALLTTRGYRAAARTHTREAHSGSEQQDRRRANGQHCHQHNQHTHKHGHNDTGDADPHLHLPLVGGYGHKHTTRAYLRTGVVGALFTLSPPLSMIAFAGTLLPTLGFETVALAVLAYAVSITLAMAAIGASISTVLRVSERYNRAYGAVRIAVGLSVVGFGVITFVDAFPLF